MIVTIFLFDLEFEAEVDIISTPRRATWESPEEFLEIEVTDLTFEGAGALWLRRSEELRDLIDDRAYDAVAARLESERVSRLEDLAQARAEDWVCA